MPSNAQCERCGAYALPAFSTERLCEECREVVRMSLRRALDDQDGRPTPDMPEADNHNARRGYYAKRVRRCGRPQ